MGKLPMGVPNRHVKTSQGGDTDIMKFYCTQYGTTYGKKFAQFQPRQGRHTGTGYVSNFRPGVYYNERLDELDNPTMGRIVADNYHTITEKSFRPYEIPDGKEDLPNHMKQINTGFTREKAVSAPTMKTASDVFIDTRLQCAQTDYTPKHKPLLHKIQAKDPTELENAGYGPSYMKTETKAKFEGRPSDRSDLNEKSLGPNEETGFTHNHNIEPVGFRPDYCHSGQVPAWLTDRPTGVSLTQTHFRPSVNPRGNEAFPNIAGRSSHDTGFTSGIKPKPEYVNPVAADAYDKMGQMTSQKAERIKKNDPSDYLNIVHPNNHSTVYTGIHTPKRLRPFPNPCSEPDRLGSTAVGLKEETGFTENGNRWYPTLDNPARFVTDNNTRFFDKTPYGKDREGHTWGGINPYRVDGYTRSTGLHDMGPIINTTHTLRNLEPYAARSKLSQDAFFDDHTYDRKMHSSTIC